MSDPSSLRVGQILKGSLFSEPMRVVPRPHEISAICHHLLKLHAQFGKAYAQAHKAEENLGLCITQGHTTVCTGRAQARG